MFASARETAGFEAERRPPLSWPARGHAGKGSTPHACPSPGDRLLARVQRGEAGRGAPVMLPACLCCSREVDHRPARRTTASSGQLDAVARARDLDLEDLADGGGRPVGHHHDAVRQQHGLVTSWVTITTVLLPVRRRSSAVRPAGWRGSGRPGAEGLVVHQQHLGLHRQRAGDATRCFMPPEISCGRLCRHGSCRPAPARRAARLQLRLRFAGAEHRL